jgi:hypothetical protein
VTGGTWGATVDRGSPMCSFSAFHSSTKVTLHDFGEPNGEPRRADACEPVRTPKSDSAGLGSNSGGLVRTLQFSGSALNSAERPR